MTTPPFATDGYIDRDLSNFSQLAVQDTTRYISGNALPRIPVDKESGLYFVFSAADLMRLQVKELADGAEPAESGFGLSQSNYACKVWALAKGVTDRQRYNATGPAIQPFNNAVMYLTTQFLIHRDKQLATVMFDSTNWDHTATIGTVWTDANADPVVDIRNAKRLISETGFEPNRIIFGRNAYDKFIDHDRVLKRLDGAVTPQNMALVNRQRAAEVLELDGVYVLNAVETTTDKGVATQTTKRIRSGTTSVDDSFVLYHAPDSIGLNEPTAAAFFMYGLLEGQEDGAVIDVLPQPARYRMRVAARSGFDLKVVSSALGAYAASVV